MFFDYNGINNGKIYEPLQIFVKWNNTHIHVIIQEISNLMMKVQWMWDAANAIIEIYSFKYLHEKKKRRYIRKPVT